MTEIKLTGDEQTLAAQHGLAVYANRLVFDAMPPINAKDLARIESSLLGPIPQDLRDLWAVSFGGRLAYDLRVSFDGFHAKGSCEQMFYPGSDHYRDLFGWIEHEAMGSENAAKSRGREWSGKIDILPFAGFEYLERYYVVVDPKADDCGAVLCWRAGVPIPDLPITSDCLTTVAPSLSAFFGHLMLESAGLAEDDDYSARFEVMERLGELAATDAQSRALAEKLTTIYLDAALDWRAALADGSLAGIWVARAAAMEAAIDDDDAALMAELLRLGVDPNETVHGGFTPLRYALLKRAFGCAESLLTAGADPTPAQAFMPEDTPEGLKTAMGR